MEVKSVSLRPICRHRESKVILLEYNMMRITNCPSDDTLRIYFPVKVYRFISTYCDLREISLKQRNTKQLFTQVSQWDSCHELETFHKRKCHTVPIQRWRYASHLTMLPHDVNFKALPCSAWWHIIYSDTGFSLLLIPVNCCTVPNKWRTWIF